LFRCAYPLKYICECGWLRATIFYSTSVTCCPRFWRPNGSSPHHISHKEPARTSQCQYGLLVMSVCPVCLSLVRMISLYPLNTCYLVISCLFYKHFWWSTVVYTTCVCSALPSTPLFSLPDLYFVSQPAREYWMIYRVPHFLVVILFGSYPTNSPLYRQYLRLSTHRKTKSEPERQLADESGDGMGGGAKSYDGEKALSSVNHSILYGLLRNLCYPSAKLERTVLSCK
jgi:hypothetical protein